MTSPRPRKRRSSRAGSSLRFEEKIRPPAGAARWVVGLARPLVFTNGVFDLLHRGHATYLEQARELGAALLVALNSDASARRLGNKEPGCPVVELEDRMAMVAALGSVDVVTWFDEDTPATLIELLRPEVLVKGGDWPADQIVGGKETLARGGRVLSIPFRYQRSSSALLEKIRKA